MNEKTQYEFKLSYGEEITGILTGETNEEWIVKIKDGNIKSIPKKNVIDCRVVPVRQLGALEVMENTIRNMLEHGM